MKQKNSVYTLIACALLAGCLSNPKQPAMQGKGSGDADDLYIVDCLLPGQIRQLGQLSTYLTARRPIKTTAVDCEIRGGEYVAYDRASYATSLKVWMPKAQAGDTEAQVYVGEIYEKGLGMTPDYAMAAHWYRKAAEQGNSRARINLGFLYEKGLGVPEDKARAMTWYKKASGLENTGIPYATTLATTATDSNVSQLRLLEAELQNSRNETRTLADQLNKTRQRLQVTRQKLARTGSQLDKAKDQFGKAEIQTDRRESSRLQEVITEKEQEVTTQRKNLAALEKQYQAKLHTLNSKLGETERRAEQIARELKSNKIATDTAQLKLLAAQAQLAKTERRILLLKNESPAKTTVEALQQAQKNALHAKQRELQKINRIVAAQEQEKRRQKKLIAQLQSEKNTYRENIARLNEQLQSQSTSTAQLQRLKQELQQQQQAALQAKQQLQTTKMQLGNTEQRLAELEKQLQAKSDKLDETIRRQNHTQDAVIVQQQKQISRLQLEKRRYEEKIKKLQADGRIATGKPEIEIIEPPVVLLRGTATVNLRSVVRQGNIIGKVRTSSGLLSLSVNDKKYSIDDRGLFQASIDLAAEKTPVHIAAIDKLGRRASLDFVFSLDKALKANQERASYIQKQPQTASWKSHDFGNYHALIIGNSNYRKIPKLDTPINDARAVARVLRKKYGFTTKLLIDATRYQILSELNRLRGELNDQDNLLIYYAGHGELDKVNMRGHWLPVDADADNTANWISTVALTDILNSMSVRHILVVADSCYSGAMTRTSLARLDTGLSPRKKSQWLKAMLKARSRTVLTSGGLKPVMDGGGGDHSVFAKSFIAALQNNNDLLEGQMLYRNVSAGIVAIAAQYGIEQVPVYAPIRYAGHENGEFFFVPN